jgi:hypothetical protein
MYKWYKSSNSKDTTVLFFDQILEFVILFRDIEILFAPLQDQVIKLLNIATEFTPHVFVITNAEVFYYFLP